VRQRIKPAWIQVNVLRLVYIDSNLDCYSSNSLFQRTKMWPLIKIFFTFILVSSTFAEPPATLQKRLNFEIKYSRNRPSDDLLQRRLIPVCTHALSK
jgi:hypothetical protein